MTHLDIFGQFRPFAIGFDRYFEDLERMSNISQTNYPPYNVVKEDDEHFTVELAVAGFSKKDVSITCLLYTSPSPRDLSTSRMPSSA